jgi:hypothetical protein
MKQPALVEVREPCPTCGSLARTFNLMVGGTIQAHSSIRIKARHGQVGDVKPFHEQTSADDYHRDSKEWRRVSRVIDRENDRYNDRYNERITDAAGNVVREVDEPLSEHRGRGAAKRRPPIDPPP